MDRQIFNRLFTLSGPAQNPDEMYWLTQLLERENVKVVVEVGVQEGGSLTFWWLLLNPSLLVGVDVNPLVAEMMTKTRGWTWGFEGVLHSRDRPVHLIIGDSTDPKTVEEVRTVLAGNKVDLLFLDANHDYDYVKADFTNYSPLVRKGGLVVLHDVNYEGPDRLFNELKNSGKTDSVRIWRDGMGYGVWYKP